METLYSHLMPTERDIFQALKSI